MTRICLSRLPGERVLVTDGDATRDLALADLPAYVAERELELLAHAGDLGPAPSAFARLSTELDRANAALRDFHVSPTA